MPKSWLTPPQIAADTGKDVKAVHDWIRRGELLAFNLAERVGERPRYKVRVEDWQAFLRRRQVQPPVPRQQRRRKSRPREGVPQYV